MAPQCMPLLRGCSRSTLHVPDPQRAHRHCDTGAFLQGQHPCGHVHVVIFIPRLSLRYAADRLLAVYYYCADVRFLHPDDANLKVISCWAYVDTCLQAEIIIICLALLAACSGRLLDLLKIDVHIIYMRSRHSRGGIYWICGVGTGRSCP